MKLNFSILWFDDDEGWLDSLDLDELREKIRSWGFIPQVDVVTEGSEFLSKSPFREYDLIVIDRELQESQKGQGFISDLRANSIYTEVIFYTAGQTSLLWDAIRKERLEGVFVCPRTDVLFKVEKVGQQAVRKALDLENMRGIVMAEVGELDLLFASILRKELPRLPSHSQKDIFQKFHKNASKQLEAHTKALKDFATAPTVHTMLEMCDSEKLNRNFNRLCRKSNTVNKPGSVGDYSREILQVRNHLAHGAASKNGDGSFTFTHKGSHYRFNETVGLNLRQTIMKWKNALRSIDANL